RRFRMGAAPRSRVYISRNDKRSLAVVLAPLLAQRLFQRADCFLDAAKVGVNAQRMTKRFERGARPAQVDVALGHAAQRAEVIRIEFQDALAVGDGLLEILVAEMEDGPLIVRLGELWGLGNEGV